MAYLFLSWACTAVVYTAAFFLLLLPFGCCSQDLGCLPRPRDPPRQPATRAVQRAEAMYRRCLDVNPEHGFALYNLAVLKEETTKNGDYSEVSSLSLALLWHFFLFSWLGFAYFPRRGGNGCEVVQLKRPRARWGGRCTGYM